MAKSTESARSAASRPEHAQLDESYARQTAQGIFRQLGLNFSIPYIEKEMQAPVSIYALILGLYAAKLHYALTQTQTEAECDRIEQMIAKIDSVSKGTGRPTASHVLSEEQQLVMQKYQQLVEKFQRLKEHAVQMKAKTHQWDEQIHNLAKRLLNDWEQLQNEYAREVCELLAQKNPQLPADLEEKLTQALMLNVGDPTQAFDQTTDISALLSPTDQAQTQETSHGN